ncbi:carboxypeptidase-like regulatory domain-containing protein, partial [Bacteroides heparinolyticus]
MKKNRAKRFCLLTLFMLWTSFYAFAQEEPKVSVHLRNASLQEVFSFIEAQTSYRFSYRETVIDNRKDISLQMENTPVSSVLNQALRGRNLTYKIVSHTSIVITDKVNQTGNQNRPQKITGIVRDSGGEPVIGVSILAEGSTNGTTTDIDGRFSLDVSPGSLLIFSYIGYQSQKVAVKDKSVLEIVLKEDTEL